MGSPAEVLTDPRLLRASQVCDEGVYSIQNRIEQVRYLIADKRKAISSFPKTRKEIVFQPDTNEVLTIKK